MLLEGGIIAFKILVLIIVIEAFSIRHTLHDERNLVEIHCILFSTLFPSTMHHS